MRIGVTRNRRHFTENGAGLTCRATALLYDAILTVGHPNSARQSVPDYLCLRNASKRALYWVFNWELWARLHCSCRAASKLW